MSIHDRRTFLKAAGAVATVAGLEGAGQRVSIVMDPSDTVASAKSARWAAGELRAALADRGFAVSTHDRLTDATAGDLCIVAAGRASRMAASLKGPDLPNEAEALTIAPGNAGGRNYTLACGQDARGLTYALLELADRARYAPDPAVALAPRTATAERPANKVRSIARLFCSDVEDLGWFNDRAMWPEYLTQLAGQRFNRFQLAFGIGYDFLRQVSDAYFMFTYPYLLEVPGYKVRVPQITNAERDRNLEMLRFISEQTVARGMDFQLGLWMHGYEWLDSPNPKHTIEGLTRENHGPYCRDAVRMLLKACPLISGITFRVHGESGVEEGSYQFWKTVFEGVSTCGRTVEIDMHAKGMDQTMQDLAVATGMPVKISPKYWAEHMGMPYHQADIRDQERPKAGRQVSALMKFSAGSRSFLRYGYGDLLREDRKWGVLHRIWPGTQRLLLWGDPLTAAAHSKSFRLSGSDGVEVMEPLSFKGRRGSGIAGDRCAYADTSLKPKWDWQKYLYTYRVWGRMLYNPETGPEPFQRFLAKDFGAAADDAGQALANASRILPIVTTSHGPSAANNSYWPELYTNQSMLESSAPGPYTDTTPPRTFGNASPFDPQLFSRMNEYADDLLKDQLSGKYSPVEVARWLEDYAAAAMRHLAQAEAKVPRKDSAEFRRWSIDVTMQAGLGRFFAAKFRSAVLLRIHEKTGDRKALEESVKAYRAARGHWAEVANRAKGVYKSDITVGERTQLRGHWLDRLPAIDADIAAVEKKLEAGAGDSGGAAAAVQAALGHPRRSALAFRHAVASSFRPGQSLAVELVCHQRPEWAKLWYRHLTQAERFVAVSMEIDDKRCRAVIPATYTDTPYPLQYYFEGKHADRGVWLYPGLGTELTTQPYFVLRRA